MTLEALSSHLSEGLHEANVRSMLKIATSLVRGTDSPLPYYVLASFFGDLDSLWADQPVEASQVEVAERDLAPEMFGA